MYKDERYALEEMRKLEEYNMEKIGTLDSREKPIAILGDRRWPQAVKQERDNIGTTFNVIYGNILTSAQLLEVSLFGVETVLRLERDAWSMV